MKVQVDDDCQNDVTRKVTRSVVSSQLRYHDKVTVSWQQVTIQCACGENGHEALLVSLTEFLKY
jgi:hypothetical protein